MKDMDIQYPGTLYDYTAGVLCGVLVTERVMKKLAALQANHLELVRRVLHDNMDEVFPSSWTLHYPEGKQVAVHYIDRAPRTRVEDRIKSATHSSQPLARFPVFIAASQDEAKMLADARAAAAGGEGVL